jgi:hypothetical protein
VVMPSLRDDKGALTALEGFLDSLFVRGQQNHIRCSSLIQMSKIGSFQLLGIALLHH